MKSIGLSKLRNILYIWYREYRVVFHDAGVVLFFIALPLAYPLLYASIYNPEVVRDSPIAVVDNSRTTTSRELCHRIDAAPGTKIVSYCANMEEAKELIHRRICLGILEIPHDFNKKIMRGTQSPVIFYADMSILLNYKNYLATLTDITLDMGKELQSRKLVGATREQTDIATNPIPHYSIVLYNPTEGFASFLMPALLVIIIQQSILLGIGLIRGGEYERHLHSLRGDTLIGKSLCYYSLYLVIILYVLYIVPRLFDYPQWGNRWEIFTFTTPFLLSSIFFGHTLALFVRERESVFLVIVFTSMIFLFLSGVTWPYDRMPLVWKIVEALIPSTWGVEGFIRMSTDAATLYDVRGEYLALWGLTILYFGTAILGNKWLSLSTQKQLQNEAR